MSWPWPRNGVRVGEIKNGVFDNNTIGPISTAPTSYLGEPWSDIVAALGEKTAHALLRELDETSLGFVICGGGGAGGYGYANVVGSGGRRSGRGVYTEVNMATAPEKARAQIESDLAKFGVTSFGYVVEDDTATIAFKYGKGSQERRVRLTIPVPSRCETRFTMIDSGRKPRTESAALELWQRATNAVWGDFRALIRAKLDAVQTGLTTMDHEFMAFMVTPTGETLHDHLKPTLDEGLARPGALLVGWER